MRGVPWAHPGGGGVVLAQGHHHWWMRPGRVAMGRGGPEFRAQCGQREQRLVLHSHLQLHRMGKGPEAAWSQNQVHF